MKNFVSLIFTLLDLVLFCLPALNLSGAINDSDAPVPNGPPADARDPVCNTHNNEIFGTYFL